MKPGNRSDMIVKIELFQLHGADVEQFHCHLVIVFHSSWTGNRNS
jgi:hypothetical protein